MKRLLTFLSLVAVAHGAGSVQQSLQQLGNTNNWVLAFLWTGDASNGSVPVTVGQGLNCCTGYLVVQVETTPGTPNPTAGYSVAIQDSSGVDVLNGAAASLSATTAQSFAASTSAPPLQGVLNLVITGQSVASAKGTVYVFLSKPGSINVATLGRGAIASSANWITLANSPVVDARTYTYTPQNPGTSLPSGACSFLMIPMPTGLVTGGSVYISGGVGTAEALTNVTVSGNTVSGTCANTHSGNYSVQSATAGCQESYSVISASGGKIIYPAGNFKTYAVCNITTSSIWIEGQGIGATTIANQTTDSSNIFAFNAPSLAFGNGLSNLQITAPNTSGGPPTTKAGGWAIALTNQEYFTLHDVFIFTVPNGLELLTSGGWFTNVQMREPLPTNGEGIFLNTGNTFDDYISHFTCDASATYKAGVEIVNSGYVNIDRADVIHANIGLLVDPGASQSVASLDVIGSLFDTPATNGLKLAPSAAGGITRVRLTNSWTSSAQTGDGILMAPTGSFTNIDSVTILGAHVLFNKQNGINMAPTSGGVISNVVIDGSIIGGNSLGSSGSFNGVVLSGSGVTNGLAITNSVIGAAAGSANAQNYGIVIGASALFASGAGLVLQGNILKNNVTGPLNDGGGTFPRAITNNDGIDDAALATIASAATITLSVSDFPNTYISGNTAVTTINGGWVGRKITLIKTDATGALTVGGGGNVPLAHTMNQFSSLTLTWDGFDWY